MPTITSSNVATATRYAKDGSPAFLAALAAPAITAATAASNAATCSAIAGKVTSEALTTAAAASYTCTITNTLVAAADNVVVSIANGTNTQGITVVSKVTPAAGSFVVIVHNLHGSQALNGTIVLSFFVHKAGV
jgi:Na+-transporting NADH:ubiquinone oxidoreductase subunit NqrD